MLAATILIPDTENMNESWLTETESGVEVNLAVRIKVGEFQSLSANLKVPFPGMNKQEAGYWINDLILRQNGY